jgi:putative chitinase
MPTENEIEMLRAARAAGINTRAEMANFMGQMGHESGGFTRLEEGFRYTRGIDQIPVASARREGDEALEAARLAALDGRPQELGRLMYGNRMGNDDAGDGYLYRGRGYTQLTGESNYRDAGTALNLDLVNNPDLAANRDNAQRIALWYWENRVPQADRDDVTRATVAINGRTNGLPDRLDRYDAWHAVLTPEFIADLDAGRVVAGAGVGPAAGRPAMEDNALRRLETGDEVRQLNDNLRALNIRADRDREVPAGQTFTSQTEQAVRRFQEQQQLPVTGRADPDTLQAVNRAIEQQQRQREQQQQNAPVQPPGEQAPGRPQGRRAESDVVPLNDPNHVNRDMYATLLGGVRERGASLGLTASSRDEDLAAGLTAEARQRGLTAVGFAQFTPEGNRVAMTDTPNPYAEWARTATGDVPRLANQPMEESSRQVAEANRAQGLRQDAPSQQQTLDQNQTQGQNNPTIRGPSLA